jgi:hypothetical protein
MNQLSKYEGSFFDEIKDKMVVIPVRFHYGMFALSYLRYKALLKPSPVAPQVTATGP